MTIILASSDPVSRAVGAAVLVLCVWLLVWKAVDLVLAARARAREAMPPGTRPCERCGYDLRASEERCPECGTPIPPLELPRTPAVERLELDAETEARAAGADHVGTQHVLLALLLDEDTVASHVLAEFDADEQSVREALEALDRPAEETGER